MLRARAGLRRALQRHLEAEGYLQVDTPALTAADCEGAGDVFSVTVGSQRPVLALVLFQLVGLLLRWALRDGK